MHVLLHLPCRDLQERQGQLDPQDHQDSLYVDVSSLYVVLGAR